MRGDATTSATRGSALRYHGPMRLLSTLATYAGLLGWLFGPLLAYEWRKARRDRQILRLIVLEHMARMRALTPITPPSSRGPAEAEDPPASTSDPRTTRSTR